MNDHNLDDLIIDTIAPKNGKSKSFLTIIALLLIVLIVAIILTKTLLKSPAENGLTFEENLTTMIAPELQLTEPVKVKKPTQNVETLKINNTNKKPEIKKPEVKQLELQKPEITYEVSAPIKVAEIKKPLVEKIVTKKPITKKPVTKKPVIKRPVTKNPSTKKPVVQKKTTHKKPSSSSRKKYYVQVGSFKETPSARFLSVIKSSGFKYLITRSDARGYKKLLIGPYNTRTAVDKARNLVRDRIHKSAFVVQR